MESENLTKKQYQKQQFFLTQNKLFDKKTKVISSQFQNTTSILSKIANKPKFTQIKQRYKTEKFLSKILLQSHLNWILYAFYRNNTLYIATQNHIGQSELNLQKLSILQYCKKSSNFNFIEKISIFRDENFYKNKQNTKNIIQDRFKERSYGIFDNHLKDKKLHKIVNNIKKEISNN
jgi:hypothetical protein